jgi:hypothetical protein
MLYSNILFVAGRRRLTAFLAIRYAARLSADSTIMFFGFVTFHNEGQIYR